MESKIKNLFEITQGSVTGNNIFAVNSESGVYKQGSIKTITFFGNPTTTLNANTWHTIATIPDDFKPYRQIRVVALNIISNKCYNVVISQSGNIRISDSAYIPENDAIQFSTSYI
jgi:hypothetical protein